MTSHRALRSIMVGLLAASLTAGAAGAADFVTPPPPPNIPAAPTAPGPAGIPDDEPGNNVHERAETAAQATDRARMEADQKVMKAIRDGVAHPDTGAHRAPAADESQRPRTHRRRRSPS